MQESRSASVWRTFWAAARRKEIVRRAAKTSLVVGTILALVNHGPDLLQGSATPRRWLQIALTYAVPYCVATYAAAMQQVSHDARPSARRNSAG